MKTSTLVLAIALSGGLMGGGYWLGAQRAPLQVAAAVATDASASAPKARKLLYYRNPMGLADTSPTPKKDPMGMDYVPVYEGGDEGEDSGSGNGASLPPGQVRISSEKVQKLGVRTEAASLRSLARTIRAAGRVEVDERRVYAVTARFEGYVERLHVNATGQPIGKGQPLFEVYSPDMVAAQREYLIAVQGQQAMKDAGTEAQAGMKQLADASLARLRNWELSPDQLASLVKTGQPQRTIAFASPVAGVVTEKKALQGMRFMPGEMLYQVTDLSSVWVIADLAEQDIGQVRNGAPVKVSTTAYPSEVFNGRVSYVYPTAKAETRSIPVRVELANPGQRLKPAMYAQVELAVGKQAAVLTVPDSAVIDTGTRRLVLVQAGEGRFEPREVELGARGDNLIEVLKGLREGEQVVVAANFLIDAESNLKAAVGGLASPGGHAGHGSPAAPATQPSAAPAKPAALTGATSKAEPSPVPDQGAKPQPSAAPQAAAQAVVKPSQVGHQASGRIDALDPKDGSISLEHGPVPSLKWPGMTMEFKVATSALLTGLKPGQQVDFEFVERQPGDFVVTAIRPVARPEVGSKGKPAPAASAAPAADHGAHSGH